jgi:hypothetical protein
MGEVVGMAAAVCKRRGASPRAVYASYWGELADLLRRGAGKSPGANPHYENQGEPPAKTGLEKPSGPARASASAFTIDLETNP